uniref:Uncharacterized protein n=1 Tax=viral metagenome TaxID=1070528 RepID=A0A6C0KRK6_9ZZZZ
MLKNLKLLHYRNKSLFDKKSSRTFRGFQKWTKINVQNPKPKILFEKKLLLKISPEV